MRRFAVIAILALGLAACGGGSGSSPKSGIEIKFGRTGGMILPYTITIAPDGLKVTEKGKRKGQEISWRSIISGDASLNSDLNASVDATTP